ILLANGVAWLLIAPLGDVLIYSEPANKVWAQGALAFAANSVTACILATIILSVYARTRTRSGSLSRDQ
ncbi:MAG: ECF transporter S component, partial [Brachybacterium tyrofermentans]